MKRKDYDAFLRSEQTTVRCKGLGLQIIRHMKLSDTDGLSDWIRDAIEFRLKYDTMGTGEIFQSAEVAAQLGDGVRGNVQDVSLLPAISSRLDEFQSTALTDNEMMIRLMLQIRSIMTDGLGRVICDNPNINIQNLNIMDIAKTSVEKSKELVEKHRGR